VSVATGNLRTVSDTVGLFLATECAFEPDVMISRMAFKEMFEKWCEEEGVKQKISMTSVTQRISDTLIFLIVISTNHD